MSKSKESPHLNVAKEFTKENWPTILASTVAGATILLLIKYYRSKNSEGKEDDQLNGYAEEAAGTTPETPMLLEVGLPVLDSIPEADRLAEELEETLEEPARSIMNTLKELGKGRKKSNS